MMQYCLSVNNFCQVTNAILSQSMPVDSVFLRRFEEPKRSLKIVQCSLKICFYNSVNKAKYSQER